MSFSVASTDAVVHLLVRSASLGGRSYDHWERARRKWREKHSPERSLTLVAVTVAPCPAEALVELIADRKAMAYHRRRVADLLRKWGAIEDRSDHHQHQHHHHHHQQANDIVPSTPTGNSNATTANTSKAMAATWVHPETPSARASCDRR